jgi:putative FmdB family regulatory protein
MPIYEYRREKGHTFDVMQRVDDEPVSKCEVCGRPVRRVFHPVAVHFKGSGFYNTDYGTRKRAREKADSSSSASSDAKSSSSDGKGSSGSSGSSETKSSSSASSSTAKSTSSSD